MVYVRVLHGVQVQNIQRLVVHMMTLQKSEAVFVAVSAFMSRWGFPEMGHPHKYKWMMTGGTLISGNTQI